VQVKHAACKGVRVTVKRAGGHWPSTGSCHLY